MITLNQLRRSLVGIIISVLSWQSATAYAAINPDFFYFSAGDTPENWVWVLGDEKNWWQPLEGNEGVSGTGKLKISRVDYQAKGDAVNLKWGKKDTWAVANISGRTVDLSKYENAAELVIVIKIDSKIKGNVKLAMDCGDKCRAEVPIADLLNQAKPKTWFVLPIALDCFSKAGVKLNTVMTPFSIGSNSKLSLSIASINIQKKADATESCKATEETIKTK